MNVFTRFLIHNFESALMLLHIRDSPFEQHESVQAPRYYRLEGSQVDSSTHAADLDQAGALYIVVDLLASSRLGAAVAVFWLLIYAKVAWGTKLSSCAIGRVK